MSLGLPVIAGTVSTVLFALGILPMLVKAATTRDLSSYSLGNIGLSNVANVVHSVYVFNLPPGPVWVLHSFHLISTGLMLIWYLRYSARLAGRRESAPSSSTRAYTELTTPNDLRICTFSRRDSVGPAPSVAADDFASRTQEPT